MSCKPYRKGNRFSQYCSIADAAVEWQGLSDEQLELVLIDENGMPFLAGVQDLADRAEAILEAAQGRQIEGHTHTEDGYPRRPDNMMLSRDSVSAWMAKANTRIATPPPEVVQHAQLVEPALLSTEQVCKRLGWSRSKLNRKTKPKGDFPKPTHPCKDGGGGVNQWRADVVQAYIDGNAREVEGEDT